MRARMRISVSLFVAMLATPALLIGSAGSSGAQVGNSSPEARADTIAVTTGVDVDLPVLANDTDADGDPLTIVSFEVITPSGSTVFRDTQDPNVLLYQPGPNFFETYDHFVYEISDGNGGTATGFATVVVDHPLPPPSPIQVRQTRIDFGTVPLGKTALALVEIRNVSQNTIGPFRFWEGPQRAPQPFETNFAAFGFSECNEPLIFPGDTCIHPLRFWSIAGADDAAPAVLEIFSAQSPGVLLGAVPMFAETAPAEPGPPNDAPVAADDFEFASQPGPNLLDPTRYADDADNDQVRISTATDPLHGSVAIESCAGIGAGRSPSANCLRYTPDADFVGIDDLAYSISDGRSGTDSAVMYIVVRSFTQDPSSRIDSVTPNHGPPAGGYQVTIAGANFVPRSSVTFRCGALHTTVSAVFVSTSQLAATVPARLPSGTCDVHVASLYLSGVLAGGYTVDTLPRIRLGAGTIVEGDGGTTTLDIPLTLSAPAPQPVTVQWKTVHVNAGNEQEAKPGDDYVAASGAVTFTAGQASASVPITINGDRLDEHDELLAVSFHSPTNATIGGLGGLALGSITDDDIPPKIEPAWVALQTLEGDSSAHVAVLSVALSAPSGRTVEASWDMPFSGGAGVAEPDDYQPAAGSLRFAPGTTTGLVNVVVNGDIAREEDELVGVRFHTPANATLGGVFGVGAVRIVNDD